MICQRIDGSEIRELAERCGGLESAIIISPKKFGDERDVIAGRKIEQAGETLADDLGLGIAGKGFKPEDQRAFHSAELRDRVGGINARGLLFIGGEKIDQVAHSVGAGNRALDQSESADASKGRGGSTGGPQEGSI